MSAPDAVERVLTRFLIARASGRNHRCSGCEEPERCGMMASTSLAPVYPALRTVAPRDTVRRLKLPCSPTALYVPAFTLRQVRLHKPLVETRITRRSGAGSQFDSNASSHWLL